MALMEDKSSILSICIPTYNRAELIGITIESFIEQVERYNIPIYVSNNASTDNTVEVVEGYKKMYPNIHIHTNATNVGFDRNVDTAVKMSSSKFCWTFSDDDTICSGAIDTVLEKIEQGYELVIVNNAVYDKNLEEKRQSHYWSAEDKEYIPNDHNQLMNDNLWYMTFVSCMVVNRLLWSKVYLEPYYGTAFVHLGAVFTYIKGRKAYYIGEPYIKMRSENSSWTRRKFQIINFGLPKTLNLLTDYDIEIKRKQVNIDQKYKWHYLMRSRALGYYHYSDYKKILTLNRSRCFPNRIFIWLVAVVPKWICMLFFWFFPTINAQIKAERKENKKEQNYL